MTRSIRRAAVNFALAAMLLRALLPAGWMPSATAWDAPFVICAMDGSVQLVLGADGQPLKQQPDQNNDRSHETCPFAAAPHLAPPAIAAALEPTSSATSTAPETIQNNLNKRLASYAPQSPRGPPSLV